MKPVLIFCVVVLSIATTYAQNPAVTMDVINAEYRNGKLGFRLKITNNSTDTLYVIDAGALRFQRNNRVYTPEEMGLKQLPYSISSGDFIPCPEKIVASTGSAWPDKRRKSIEPELFVSIPPRASKRLLYSEFKDDDFCIEPGTKSFTITVKYKAVVNPNYFTPEQLKELGALIKECESLEKELPVSDLSQTKNLLRYYLNYQGYLDRLYTGVITSKEGVVQVK